MPIVRVWADGRITIPADIRRRHGVVPGTAFTVIETADGVLLRKLAAELSEGTQPATRSGREGRGHRQGPCT